MNIKKFCLTTFTSAILLTCASVALAEENQEELEALYEHGKDAHHAHCNKCHQNDIYTRENRFVKSMAALSKQVKRCAKGNSIPWFDEDADAVSHFVNEKYYKF